MHEIFRWIGGIFCFIVFFGSILPICSHYGFETRYYDIYNLKAPFGIFWTEGGMSGNIIYFRGYTEMVENYVVKYFDGNELKTKIFNAEETSIVVDNTLRLEQLDSYTEDGWWWYRSHHRRYNVYPIDKWIIHIPYLPDINTTLTEDWDIPN